MRRAYVIIWLALLALPVWSIELPLQLQHMEQDGGNSSQPNPYADGDSDSDPLQEWAPVSASIVKGQKNYFEFSINNTDAYSQLLQTYEMFIFISANICKRPNNTDEDIVLALYYTFDSRDTANFSAAHRSLFSDGYLEALALRPYQEKSDNSTNTDDSYSKLYFMVQLITNSTGEPFEEGQATLADEQEVWTYQISISQRDLVFQWDLRPWLDVVDTDFNSALLVTGNVTASVKGRSNYSIYDVSLYDLYVYEAEYEKHFDELELSHSLCAIENGPYLISSANKQPTAFNKIIADDLNGGGRSTSENVSLSSTELAVHKSITLRGSGAKEQFHITGLNSSTTYVAYVTKKLATNSKELKDSGGVVFSKQLFTTMEDPSCSLIFGLNFCDGVAYSVPSSSLLDYDNKTALAELYDSVAQSYYSNFSLALQLVPCDTEKDAIYSPLRSCQDCAMAYKNWVCSVSIPRCTTVQSSFYIPRTVRESRNKMLNDRVKPSTGYYEILPCIDTCIAMVRDCPPQFGFSCPRFKSRHDLMLKSYNFYDVDEGELTCNFVGNAVDLHIRDSSDYR